MIRKLLKNRRKTKNIWSLKFIIYNYLNNKKYIYPNKSQIKNIGFDGSGVNSKITDKFTVKYYQAKKLILVKLSLIKV